MQPKPTAHFASRSLATTLFLALAFLGTVATGATRDANTPVKREVVPKSPGEIASQVCMILANHKTPWQIHRTYTNMFVQFAKNQERVPVRTREAQQKRQRLVVHYRNMASLLQQMQTCAEIRDGIKHNQTDIPFGRRQTTYTEQGKRLDALLSQFAKMGGRLHGFTLPKKFSRKR